MRKSKRRKKLKADLKKKPKSKTLSPNNPQTNDPEDILDQNQDHIFNKDDDDTFDEDDDDTFYEDEDEDYFSIEFSFDFTIHATCEDNQQISDSGHADIRESVLKTDYYDGYIDDCYLFSKACQSTLESLYHFGIEKQGNPPPSEITLTIKNLDFKW